MQITANSAPKPEECTTSYRCPLGHQNKLYIMIDRSKDLRVTTLRGSSWEYCGTCRHGPNTVQKMQLALDIYRQWRTAGIIDQDEHHQLANAAVTQDTRKHRGPAEEFLDKLNELMMLIEIRTAHNHAANGPGARRRFLELRRDLDHVKRNFQQWAIREKLMQEPQGRPAEIRTGEKPEEA